MQANHYSMSEYNSSAYMKKLKDYIFIYLLLYVDDMLNACKNISEIKKLKAQLNEKLGMKDLELRRKFWEWRSTEIENQAHYFFHKRSTLKRYLNVLGCKMRSFWRLHWQLILNSRRHCHPIPKKLWSKSLVSLTQKQLGVSCMSWYLLDRIFLKQSVL